MANQIVAKALGIARMLAGPTSIKLRADEQSETDGWTSHNIVFDVDGKLDYDACHAQLLRLYGHQMNWSVEPQFTSYNNRVIVVHRLFDGPGSEFLAVEFGTDRTIIQFLRELPI